MRTPDGPGVMTRRQLPEMFPLTEVGLLASQPAAFQEWRRVRGAGECSRRTSRCIRRGKIPKRCADSATVQARSASQYPRTRRVTIHRAEPGLWIGDSGILAGTTRVISEPRVLHTGVVDTGSVAGPTGILALRLSAKPPQRQPCRGCARGGAFLFALAPMEHPPGRPSSGVST